MTYFVHPQGLCESKKIGNATRIWAFTHVLPGATIGENCNICDHVFIENDVTVGDRVTIKSGVQLWDGIVIEDDVFIGPNATFTNDRFPRSKQYPDTFLKTRIRKNASIGANATLLPGITVGRNAMVGAGSVVLKSVPPNAIVAGNPAKIIGFVNFQSQKNTSTTSSDTKKISETGVQGVKLHRFSEFKDKRGSLTVGEFQKEIPFLPKRYFIIYDNTKNEVRGEHAHKACHQFLICIKGSCRVIIDDGKSGDEILLNSPNIGLHMEPMIWSSQYEYSPDSVLLVFASHHYDPDDYIKDYEEFLVGL